MRRVALALCTTCLLGVSVPARAADVQITPMIGFTIRTNTNLVDLGLTTPKPHNNIGGALTVLSKGIFGVEGIGAWTPRIFEANAVVRGGHSIALMGNAVFAAPRTGWVEYNLRPYASAGLGMMNVKETDVLGFIGSHTVPGFDVGGGAIGFLTAHTGLRFDLRYYSTLRAIPDAVAVTPGPPHLRYMTLSFGVVIRR